MPVSTDATLYYVHDPMCSWCWGFRTSFEKLLALLTKEHAESLKIQYVLAGLAADNADPMPTAMRQYLQQTWEKIAATIPSTVFNHDFWTVCAPRRSTYIACRAVIAARLQQADADQMMILAIQKAYYLNAQNPSELDTLSSLALELGLDQQAFIKDINTPSTQLLLQQEIDLARHLGAESFPSLILQINDEIHSIDINYLQAEPMLQQIQQQLKT